jgi:hypothetical protein
MVTLTDVIVLTGSGLVGGICTGLLIRNKQINNLKDEVAASDNSYVNLLDKYMEIFSSYRKLMTANNKPKVAKKGPGRPKGSKNKTKQDGGSTTRKYTRKSSK